MCLLFSSPVAQAQRPGGGSTNATGGGGGPIDYFPAEETPWSHLIDSLTAPLSKSQIPSGILYDRALPLAALHSFGVRRADTTSSAHLRQAYLELWIAAYNRSLFVLTPDQFRERANRVVRHDSVPLAVLDYQFHWLDTLAVQDGLVSLQNGVLHNVSAPSRSPYLLRNLTLAAPLVDTLRQSTATFVLPAGLLLTNRTRRVSGITVDFNDGGSTHALLPGQAFTVTYSSNGRKVVWFMVQFNDGSTAQVRSAIYVKVPTVNYRSEPITLVNLATVEARIPFQDYNSATSLFGQGDVLAVLHNPSSLNEFDNSQTIKLRRPVIIMDGFDPKDERQLFDNNGEIKSVYNDLEGQGILTLLNDQNLQRDLIILNFPNSPRHTATGATTAGDIDGGADYVERNALVLVELINRLKPMLAIDPATGQPYQFTIIGPSMGGLISRYALAYMEKQAAAGANPPAGQTAAYWQHNTATWVSFDAPHQGAVVPMGDQAFLGFFQGVAMSARETLNTTLYSPAAKQMLVHHILAPGTTPVGAPGFRDRFMQALRDNGEPNSLGYPVHLRRVAIADGQLNGQSDAGGTPCGKMFDVEMKLRTGYAIAATVLSVLFLPFGSQAPTRVGACTARYTPAPNTSCTVFEGVLNYGTYSFQFPGGFNYMPVYGRRVVDAGSQGSYDLAPGGSRATQESLRQQAEGAGQGEKYKVDVTGVHPNHCFIPTVSALGFQYQSTTSYQNTSSLPNPYTNLLTRGDLVCNNEIPFDDFYAPATGNLAHVTTDAGAVAFLIRELTPRVATPVFTAAPTAMCPGTRATFSVANCAPRTGQPVTGYVWTAGGDLSIISGQGTPTVLVEAATNGASGLLQVVATRTGYQDSAPAVTLPYIGNGYAALDGPSGTKCYSEDFTYSLSNITLATGPVQWHAYLDGNLRDDLFGNRSATTATVYPEAGTLAVTATLASQCVGGAAITVTSPYTYVIEFTQNPTLSPVPSGRAGRLRRPRPSLPPTLTPPMPC